MNFHKLEGSGNDFILFDLIDQKDANIKWSKYVPKLCDRKKGIGADGVLILEKDKKHDFRMRIINPDGQEVEMCGNGARCSAFYYAKKTGDTEMRFITLAGIMNAVAKKEKLIQLNMPSPTDIKLDILINVEGHEMGVSFINTGVPHVIVETNKLEDTDVLKLGHGIRYNGHFAPDGTNANFVQVTGKKSLSVRTYERGVEAETLACGTGAVASAIIETLKGRIDEPVEVTTRGGDILKVYFKITKEEDLISRINNVKLEGGVNFVFEGSTDLIDLS